MLIDRAAGLLRKETGKHIPLQKDMMLQSQNADENRNMGFPPFDAAQQWEPLLKLWSRPWFSRAWIVQESAMATSAMVVVGEHERDWVDFGVAALFFAHKSYSVAVRGLGVVWGLCTHFG